jgi:hypothetical protein
MTSSRMSTWISVACVIGAVSACSTGRDNAAGQSSSSDRSMGQATNTAAERRGGETDQASITVAGCLQKGNGNTFILTRVNEPAQSVGTGGNRDARVVEREQRRAAAGSYRVDPPADSHADGLVGKEVKIVGTVRENADLPRPGTDARAKPADINESDLTRISATSITMTRDVCQGGESPAATGTSNR